MQNSMEIEEVGGSDTFGFVDYKKYGDSPEGLILAVREAKARGDDFIEVSPEMIFRLTGQPGDYMNYMDMKVYAYGKRDEVERRLTLSVEDKVFRGMK